MRKQAKKKFTDNDYIEYLQAYDQFYQKRCKICGGGSPRVDSQFSEQFAADKVGFTLSMKKV